MSAGPRAKPNAGRSRTGRRWQLALLLGLLAGVTPPLRAEAPPPPPGPSLALPRVPRAPARPAAAYSPPALVDGACAAGAPPLAVLVWGDDAAPPMLIDAQGALQPARPEDLGARIAAADHARALGCPGGDRLLLVVEAEASGARLSEALTMVAGYGVQCVDLQVEAEALVEHDSGEAPQGRFVRVRVGHGGISLDAPRPPGAPMLGWGCPAPCAPADQPWAALEAALAGMTPGTPLLVELPTDRPAAEVARALATAPPYLRFALAATTGPPVGRPPAGALAAPARPWALGPGPVSSLPIAMPALMWGERGR